MDSAQQAPSVADLRARIAVTRVRKHRVAARLDIASSHLSNLLNGQRHLSPEMAVRIAQAIEDVATEAVA